MACKGTSIPACTCRPDPAWLQLLVRLHNVVLIALSAYMSATAALEAWRNSYNFWGNAYSPTQRGMARVVYIFYISKYYEFMDTVSAPA